MQWIFNKPTPVPKISSGQLSVRGVPSWAPLDWRDIVKFCATFDIRAEFPESCEISGVHDVRPDSTLPEMRAGLWVEYRRWNHLGRDPDDGVTIERARDIMNWIRQALLNS